MNEVFLIGKIKGKIEFGFIYKGEKISRADAILQLLDGTEIRIVGYNEIADYMYKRLYKNEIMFVYGKIQGKGNINVLKIKNLGK